ncbi:MAG: site-2 protease family protein, partial [Paludibacteraceae bacterium]|nr:site-2 protease family protein [Paludibacteraceae bacterium]
MIQVLQLALALSFLVFVHELGHFAFARLFKVRVEKFYLFFNPWFSLIRIKKFDGIWHVKILSKNTDEEWEKHPENTEWGLGWLPFGGYCAIGGMVDETHKTEDLASEMQPWEFRAKPVWQRLLIILGGILVNFVSALIIFVMLTWQYGTYKLPLRNATDGLYYSQIMLDEGFEQQDKILTINGIEPEVRADIMQALIIEGKRDVVVLRGADTVAFTVSEDFSTRYMAVVNAHDKKEREKARADKNYQKR